MADDDHDIVLFPNGPPALRLVGPSTVDPDTRSGNPHHEVATGRFGSGGRKPGKVPTRGRAPVEVPAPGSVERRRDAIVDAARSLPDLSPDGVREFVQRRWKGTRVLTEADVELFAADALRQRIEDAVDALDLRLRKAVYSRGGAKTVKIDFPRGMLRATLRDLDGPTVVSVLERLRQRGWSHEQVSKYVVRPFQMRDKAKPEG